MSSLHCIKCDETIRTMYGTKCQCSHGCTTYICFRCLPQLEDDEYELKCYTEIKRKEVERLKISNQDQDHTATDHNSCQIKQQ